MKHRNQSALVDGSGPLPPSPMWLLEMHAKHAAQMHDHQIRYGELGELQTKKQKLSLQNTLKRMKAEQS